MIAFTALALALAVHAPADSGATVHVFTDTTSMRVQVTVSGAAALVGTTVHGMITSVADGVPLWTGTVGTLARDDEGNATLTARVGELKPRLWSPQTPALYYLTLRFGTASVESTARVRFGFRRFEAKSGRFLLNGHPIFLRGNSINPPDRMVPPHLDESRPFVEAYVRYLKSIGVNIIRMTRYSDVWFNVCDELGMMVFQGLYGVPKGGSINQPPQLPWGDVLRDYKEDVLGPLVNHPSVVIYVLANELASVDVPHRREGGEEIDGFLGRLHAELRLWDDTRPYISNAGYGYGRSADVCDMHRYWGWYHNSFLSYYSLRNPANCWRSAAVQPITVTETVGAYTGPDGRFNLVAGSRQPDAQLRWTGHAPQSEQARRALGYQTFLAKQGIEITRRVRNRNPYVAGIMPFTILFNRWSDIERFEDMVPKPVANQYAISFQSLLLSWELWTTQVYAGAGIHPVAHVVNDLESRSDLDGASLEANLIDSEGRQILTRSVPVPRVPFYGAVAIPVPIKLPRHLPTGSYRLIGRVVQDGRTASRNEVDFFIATTRFTARKQRAARRVVLYDPSGRTSAAFSRLGIAHRRVTNLELLDPRHEVLVIGAFAWGRETKRLAGRLSSFIDASGRILVLNQVADSFNGDWLPVRVRLETVRLDHDVVNHSPNRGYRDALAVNPERSNHPVFHGVDRDRLFMWSDFTGWDESKPGFPEVYPVTNGFAIVNREELGSVAILANYGHGLEGIALAELFQGEGSVLMSGLGLIERAGLDPIADRLLGNLVNYMASRDKHYVHPVIDSAIRWGDFASERGVVTGIYNGLILNSIPVVPRGLEGKFPVRISTYGFHTAGSGSGWNTRPDIQYVPCGRRVFGPYQFRATGSLILPRSPREPGEARVWFRVPQGRATILTKVWNPTDEAVELSISVNGSEQRRTFAPHSTAEIANRLVGGRDGAVAMFFRGDRRLVLLETVAR